MTIPNSTNTINGLFNIPDEGSFLKKLILANKTTFNPDILLAFKILQQNHSNIEMIQKENYFSLLLPTTSEGLQLEAMIITTLDEEKNKLLSIYHRLHFDTELYQGGISLIEADVFLRLSAVIVNAPINENEYKIEGLATLLNYQVQEALNIEITMLSLADSSPQIAQENILPFIMNAIGRYMLAAKLDDVDYIRAMDADALSKLVAGYCDIPRIDAAVGVEKLTNFSDDIIKSEDAFIAQYASSTLCLMFLYMEKKTSEALLDKGGFKFIKAFFLEKTELFHLKNIAGSGEMLGSFKRLNNEESQTDNSMNEQLAQLEADNFDIRAI